MLQYACMRKQRNFLPDRCYHLVSRVANRAFYFSDEERTRFVERMWRVAQFSCVEVLAYCVMSNHFHILVHVPSPRELEEAEVIARVKVLYSGARLSVSPEKLDEMRRRRWAEIEADIPDRVPRLLPRGSNRVVRDILKMLSERPMRPADLRGRLGIRSANYFTERYLMPMKAAGLIAQVVAESPYAPRTEYTITAKGRSVI